MTDPTKIINFWFGPRENNPEFFPHDKLASWFNKDLAVDNKIREQFESLISQAQTKNLESWTKNNQSFLALIILIDQFSRNIYRDKAQAYIGDTYAQKLIINLIEQSRDKQFCHYERVFLYLPLEHAENVALQALSVQYFRELLHEAPNNLKKIYEDFFDYAIKHQQIIDKFGRFPHRNKILSRKSTKEEEEFLKKPGSGF